MTDHKSNEHSNEKQAEVVHDKEEKGQEKEEKQIEINLGSLLSRKYLIMVIAIILFSFYLRTYSFDHDYLLNVDSYFHYRYMRFIVEDGGIPSIDPYMMAPVGMPSGISTRTANLYHYFGAYSYILASTLVPDMELWRFLVYFPALIASLMAIPAYYIGKLIYDRKAGILMSFLVVFNPSIFMRTLGGDPDNDGFVLMMSLLAMMFFLLAYSALKKDMRNSEKQSRKMLLNIEKKTAMLSALSGVFLAAFALSWIGYWYVFYLITGVMALTALIESVPDIMGKAKPAEIISKISPVITSYVIIMAVFFALTLPFFGISFVPSTVMEPFTAVHLKGEESDFPNVYVSVQEMMAGGTVKEIVQRTGTILFFLTYMLCIPYLIGSYIKKKTHMDTMLLILLWSGGALFATLTAIRFSILLAIPISLGSAIVLSKVWRLALGEDKEVFR